MQPKTPSTSEAVSDQNQLFYQAINAISQSIDEGDILRSQQQLLQLKNQTQNADQRSLLAYAYAKLAMGQNNYTLAASLLNNPTVQADLLQSSNQTNVLVGLLNAQILAQEKAYLKAAHTRVYLAPLISDKTQYDDNQQKIWQLLANIDVDTVNFDAFKNEQDMLHWLELSRIVQHNHQSLDQQITALGQWLQENPNHPASLNPPKEIAAIIAAAAKRPNHIAFILPFDGKYQAGANAIRDGFMHAWYHNHHQAQITFYSSEQAGDFNATYQEAIDNGADMVIGPLLKEQLQALYQWPSLPVPTIALNQLDNALPAPANLYQFSLSLDDEVRSLIALATAKQYHNVLIFYQDSDWGKKTADEFSSQWLALNEQNHVIAQSPFINTKEQASQTKQLLNLDKSEARLNDLQRLTGLKMEFQPRRRQDVDLVVLITRSKEATSIKPLLAFYYAGDIPVYATSSIYQGFANRLANSDLNGVCFSDSPLVISHDSQLLAKSYQQSPLIRLYAMGNDAFRLSERLALMQSDSNANILGSTGKLSLSGSEFIRQTDYACFNNGYAKELKLSDLNKDGDYHAKDYPESETRPTL